MVSRRSQPVRKPTNNIAGHQHLLGDGCPCKPLASTWSSHPQRPQCSMEELAGLPDGGVPFSDLPSLRSSDAHHEEVEAAEVEPADVDRAPVVAPIGEKGPM